MFVLDRKREFSGVDGAPGGLTFHGSRREEMEKPGRVGGKKIKADIYRGIRNEMGNESRGVGVSICGEGRRE